MDRFSKNSQTSNFTKILSVGGHLFRADGQSDVKKLTVAYCSFANAPNKESPTYRRPFDTNWYLFLQSVFCQTFSIAFVLKH